MEEKISCQVKQSVKSIVKTIECPICLDYLDNPHRTSCFHQFCKDCIDRVLSSKSPKCPLCKEKITKRGLCKSDKLAEVIKVVRELEEAVVADTGLTSTPPFIHPYSTNEAIGTPGIALHSTMFPTPVKPKANMKRKRT